MLILKKPLLTRFFMNPFASEFVTKGSSAAALPAISPKYKYY